MERNRREFLKTFSGFGAVAAFGASRLLQKMTRSKFVRAVRAKLYPGPVASLKHDDIIKPGPWAG
jgi:hypothetical protein